MGAPWYLRHGEHIVDDLVQRVRNSSEELASAIPHMLQSFYQRRDHAGPFLSGSKHQYRVLGATRPVSHIQVHRAAIGDYLKGFLICRTSFSRIHSPLPVRNLT